MSTVVVDMGTAPVFRLNINEHSIGVFKPDDISLTPHYSLPSCLMVIVKRPIPTTVGGSRPL